nr:MAG TPA: hypothetical protein [Caudoviricetes sp.]
MYIYTKVLLNNPVYTPRKCMYMLHNRRGWHGGGFCRGNAPNI